MNVDQLGGSVAFASGDGNVHVLLRRAQIWPPEKLTRTASPLDGLFGLANCASRADDRLHEHFKPGLARMAAIVTAGDLRAELSLASDRNTQDILHMGQRADKLPSPS